MKENRLRLLCNDTLRTIILFAVGFGSAGVHAQEVVDGYREVPVAGVRHVIQAPRGNRPGVGMREEYVCSPYCVRTNNDVSSDSHHDAATRVTSIHGPLLVSSLVSKEDAYVKTLEECRNQMGSNDVMLVRLRSNLDFSRRYSGNRETANSESRQQNNSASDTVEDRTTHERGRQSNQRQSQATDRTGGSSTDVYFFVPVYRTNHSTSRERSSSSNTDETERNHSTRTGSHASASSSQHNQSNSSRITSRSSGFQRMRFAAFDSASCSVRRRRVMLYQTPGQEVTERAHPLQSNDSHDIPLP